MGKVLDIDFGDHYLTRGRGEEYREGMGERQLSSEGEVAMSLMPLFLIGGLAFGAVAGATLAYFDVNGKFPVVNGAIGGGFFGFVAGLAVSAHMFDKVQMYDEPIVPRPRRQQAQ